MIYLNGKTEVDYKANFIHKEIESPEPRLEEIEIPMRDGYINGADFLSDVIYYDSRKITIGLELRSDRWEWPLYWSQILEDLHGKNIRVEFPDDPNWYWEGVASVGKIEDHGMTAGVTITVNAQPFKRRKAWTNIVVENLSGDKTITVEVPYMRAYLEFECSAAGMTVGYAGETWSLPEGVSNAYGLFLLHGDNELHLHGSGTMRIRYRGGAL